MMYLTENSLFNISKKQYLFKLKADFRIFFSLIIVQIFAVLLSLDGMSSTSFSNESVYVRITYMSGNTVIIFTLIWAFIVSISLLNINNRNMDFTFVSNRITSNLSNIALIATMAVFGGITASLSDNLIRVFACLVYGSSKIIYENFFIPPVYILVNIIITALYIIFISSIGYLSGALVQLNRAFAALLLIVPFLIIFIQLSLIDFMSKIYNFYFSESSLIMFALKIIISAAVFFSCAILVSNRLEVRK